MQDRKKKKAIGWTGEVSLVHPDTAQPARYVRDRLRETDRLIRTLKSDLGYYRSQNSEIVKERNNLLKLLSQKEALDQQQSQLEGDFRLLKKERDQLEDALGHLMDENKEILDRCSRLEAVLAHEREKHVESMEIIVCLEAQIEQLESMVEMLLEHRRLTALVDD